jgi:hypothetical protein
MIAGHQNDPFGFVRVALCHEQCGAYVKYPIAFVKHGANSARKYLGLPQMAPFARINAVMNPKPQLERPPVDNNVRRLRTPGSPSQMGSSRQRSIFRQNCG